MPDKIKLRPMAEAPKEPVDGSTFTQDILAWDRHGIPRIICWNVLRSCWIVDNLNEDDSGGDMFIGWLPIPEVEV